MDKRPQLTIAGSAYDELDRVCKWIRDKGAGTTWTVRGGQRAVEIRGAMKHEIEEVTSMAHDADLKVYDDDGKEVCRDEERKEEEAAMAAAA